MSSELYDLNTYIESIKDVTANKILTEQHKLDRVFKPLGGKEKVSYNSLVKLTSEALASIIIKCLACQDSCCVLVKDLEGYVGELGVKCVEIQEELTVLIKYNVCDRRKVPEVEVKLEKLAQLEKVIERSELEKKLEKAVDIIEQLAPVLTRVDMLESRSRTTHERLDRLDLLDELGGEDEVERRIVSRRSSHAGDSTLKRVSLIVEPHRISSQLSEPEEDFRSKKYSVSDEETISALDKSIALLGEISVEPPTDVKWGPTGVTHDIAISEDSPNSKKVLRLDLGDTVSIIDQDEDCSFGIASPSFGKDYNAELEVPGLDVDSSLEYSIDAGTPTLDLNGSFGSTDTMILHLDLPSELNANVDVNANVDEGWTVVSNDKKVKVKQTKDFEVSVTTPRPNKKGPNITVEEELDESLRAIEFEEFAERASTRGKISPRYSVQRAASVGVITTTPVKPPKPIQRSSTTKLSAEGQRFRMKPVKPERRKTSIEKNCGGLDCSDFNLEVDSPPKFQRGLQPQHRPEVKHNLSNLDYSIIPTLSPGPRSLDYSELKFPEQGSDETFTFHRNKSYRPKTKPRLGLDGVTMLNDILRTLELFFLVKLYPLFEFRLLTMCLTKL